MLPENIFENQFPSINGVYIPKILKRHKIVSNCCTMKEKITYSIYPIGNKQTDEPGIVDPPITPEEDFCSCETPLHSGKLPGTDITWTICGNTDTLFITGTGPLPNTNSAWKNHYDAFNKIVIGNGITTIGQSAFHKCTNLVKVVISDSVTSIARDAFYDCNNLVEVTIPNSVTSIGQSAFYGCAFVELIIPDSVTNIDIFAFYLCTSLVKVTIGNSLTTIGQTVFGSCTNLVEVNISNSVTTIADRAFSACSGLVEVTIPNSVTTIGNHSFQLCTGITKMINHALVPQIINGTVFLNVNINTIVLEVPTASLTLYQSADIWKDFQNIVGI